MKRKNLLVLVIMTMLFSLHVFAEENSAVLKIITPSETIKAGESFEVAVELLNNPGIGSLKMTLSYERSLMKCTSIKTEGLLKEMLSATNPNHEDGAIIAAASAESLTTTGTVAIFKFIALSDFEECNFELKNIKIINETETDVVYRIEGVNEPDNDDTDETVTDSEITEPDVPEEDESHNDEVVAPEPVEPVGGIVTPDFFEPEDDIHNEEQYEDVVHGSVIDKDDEESFQEDKSEISEIIRPEEDKELNLFTDTVGHWAKDYIDESVALGLFKGTGENTFSPDVSISRAQFITVLWRMSGTPETKFETSFLDISEQPLEFKTAILWGQNNGYINGVSSTEFNPNGTLTREAAMKILYYYAGGQSGNEMLLTAVYDDAFVDSGDISAWAKPCVYWGVYNKLISGISKTELSPKGVVTRAQLAKILVDYYNSFAK